MKQNCNRRRREKRMKKNRIFSMIMAASLLITSVTAGLAGQNNTIKAQAADPVVICIDPGHGGTGGRNLGAQYNGISEKQVTLITANAMKAELEKYENVKVYMTRTTDTVMSLKDRADYAKAVGADFLYCIHFNSSIAHDLYGSEVWVSAYGSMYQQGYSFASVETAQLQALGLYQRGIKTKLGSQGDYYGILRYATADGVPCALIEHCYVDHGVDLSFLKKSNSYQLLGIADATAVAKYYHLKSASLGVDYSGYQNVSVAAPKTPVANDLTAPEVCKIDSAVYDKTSKTVTAMVTAKDSGSPIIYYSYSFDGGKTYSYLLPWDRTKTTDTVSIPNPKGASTLIIRAHNQYAFYTPSSAYTIN